MPFFHPTGNLEQDLPLLQAMFKDVHGLRKRPTKAVNV
jgi:hypothetical protein